MYVLRLNNIVVDILLGKLFVFLPFLNDIFFPYIERKNYVFFQTECQLWASAAVLLMTRSEPARGSPSAEAVAEMCATTFTEDLHNTGGRRV